MKAMSLDLREKVALVTGGSRGLGKAIAGALAAQGASVAICGRKQENLHKAVEELEEEGFKVLARAAHVAKAEDVKALMEAVEDRFGKLDILVNNVGMNILTPSVIQADEGLWDKILETNLKGPFMVSAQALRLLRKAGGGGKIINISSIAARKAAMGMGIYCVAKAGLEMLTRVLAVELAQEGIRVNGVAPCMVRTDFSRPFWSNEGLLKEISAGIPVGRIAEPEDVVGTVLFLASGLSDFITGEIITVDGGSLA